LCGAENGLRKLRCLSAASFEAFPFFVLHNWGPEGQWQHGRLSLLTFFGEAKKVSGCRATPHLLNDEQQKPSNQITNDRTAQLSPNLQTKTHPHPNLPLEGEGVKRALYPVTGKSLFLLAFIRLSSPYNPH